MEKLDLLLNWLGISLVENATDSPVFLLSACVLIFSIIALLCAINIIFYFTVLYLVENKTLLEKISKYKIILKLVNFYKKITMFYLIIDILTFIFWNICILIYKCLVKWLIFISLST